MVAHHSLSVLERSRKRARRAKCTARPPAKSSRISRAGWLSLARHLAKTGSQTFRSGAETQTPGGHHHSALGLQYRTCRPGRCSLCGVYDRPLAKRDGTNRACSAKAYFSAKEGHRRKKRAQKVGFLPCPPPALTPTPGLPTNIPTLISFHAASCFQGSVPPLPPALPWRPLAHIQGSCILCCSGTARDRAFCCKPVGVTNAGRGVSQQVDNQPWPAARTSSARGRSRMTGHVSMYVHTTMGLYCGLCLHLPSRDTPPQQPTTPSPLHYRRRASTALLEAHAGHATPTKRARGQAIRVGWDHEALRRGFQESPTPSPKKKPTIPVWARGGVCLPSGQAMPQTQVETGTDRRTQQASPSPPPGNFPCTFVSPAACDTTQHEEYTYVCGTTSESLHSTHHHTHPTTHTKTCLTHPPTSRFFFPRAPTNSSSGTSEEVSRECSPVGKRRRGQGGGVQLGR